MIGEAPSRTMAAERPGQLDKLFAAARIALGLYWLYEQHWKLPPDFGLHQPRGLMYAFQQGIQHPTLAMYRTFLQDVVVPHFYLFGWLIFVGETIIGLLLALGLFTQLGALLGTLEAVNLLLSQARTPEGPAIYVAILAANLFILVVGGNRAWSVDRLLIARLKGFAQRHTLLGRALDLAMWRGARPA